MPTYSFITTIDAANDEDAESAREEAGGGIEDARESGNLPEGVEMDAGELVRKDLDEVLRAYRRFHDTISVMIENGKLNSFRSAQPTSYTWMVEAMAEIAGLDQRDATERLGRE